VAINEGVRYKKRLWRDAGRKQLESLPLAPWASRRRQDLLEVLDRINPTIAELTQEIENEAEKCCEARRLMTHPGVGALTAVAFVLIIGDAHRFDCGKQIAAYLGLVPEEDSSGERRRLGHISKQGNSLLRFLLVEAAQATARSDGRWRNQIFPLGAKTRPQDRESSDGTETSSSLVLDVAPRMGLRATAEFRFAGSKTLLSYSVDQGFDSIA
jgi:transposase